MTSFPPLETERLVLCPLTIEDADQYQKIFPVWEVVRYMPTICPWPYPEGGAYYFIKNIAGPAMEKGREFR